jgi:hypothetical protein
MARSCVRGRGGIRQIAVVIMALAALLLLSATTPAAVSRPQCALRSGDINGATFGIIMAPAQGGNNASECCDMCFANFGNASGLTFADSPQRRGGQPTASWLHCSRYRRAVRSGLVGGCTGAGVARATRGRPRFSKPRAAEERPP